MNMTYYAINSDTATKLLNAHNIFWNKLFQLVQDDIFYKKNFSLFKMASCPVEEKEIDSCIKEVGFVLYHRMGLQVGQYKYKA